MLIHCNSLAQATMLKDRLKERLAACKLEMSPGKTKIVYCKDRERTEDYSEISFDFLGYTFRPRKSLSREEEVSLNFLPAINCARKSFGRNRRPPAFGIHGVKQRRHRIQNLVRHDPHCA